MTLRAPGWAVLRPALFFAAGVVITIGSWLIGGRLYDPDTRIPAPTSSPFEEGFLGTNQSIRIELALLALGVAPGAELHLAGPTFELEFPRTLADSVFDKRKESALSFTAVTTEGMRLRFLLLRDGQSQRVLAVDPSPFSIQRIEFDPEGVYIELPVASDQPSSPLMRLRAAVEALLPEVARAESEQIDSSEYTIFGSFGWSDAASERLISRLRENVVLAHLVDALDTTRADVTVGAPVYSVIKTQASSTYEDMHRLAQRSLWKAVDLDQSLGHELSHAYAREFLFPRDTLLRQALPYFAEVHPEYYGEDIRLLDEDPDRQVDIQRSMEEALAFMVGALADGQAETSHVIRRGENVRTLEDFRLITESILSSDVELLIDLGLLPGCMGIEKADPEATELPEGYFTTVERVCLAGEQ